MKTLTFYSDPGHAWLKVPIADLFRLGISDKISSYSYVHNDSAYLEEDCDASIYIEAIAPEEFEIKEIFKGNTPIRNYARYPTEEKS